MGRIGQEEIDAVIEVLKEGDLSPFFRNFLGGGKVQELERLFREYHDMKHAISTSSGTTALYSAYLACGIGKGDEIITTPLTFVSTVSMAMALGARPAFVDVNPDTYNIDPEKIESAVSKKTKAIVPVHLLGTPVDMDPLMEIAEKHDLWVIEDNAQALGAKYKGKLTGSIGDISVFSGQWTKSCTFGGEGGMILTDDEKLAKICQQARNHGEKYSDADFIGWNFRLTELQAAIGVEQFKKLDGFNRIQRKNAEILFEYLPDGISPPHIPDYAEPTLYIIGCLAEEGFLREKFVEDMTGLGINKNLPGATIGLGYQKTLMELPLLRPFKRPCPTAENLVTKFIWFDICRWRTEDEMREIAAKIRQGERAFL